jgi:phenylpropionate dioxygenase-like ring-hydroxylating dioxygenase large terminal subunit
MIRCPFHGWRWNTDGSIAHVTDQWNWGEQKEHDAEDLALAPVRLEQWGGWFWLTGGENMPSLAEFLGPVPEILANHEFENCRREWYQSIVFPCNWKNVIDAFNEAYHVEATHSQLTRYGRPESVAIPHGQHGMFCYPSYTQNFNAGSEPAEAIDYRQLILEREQERDEWLHALISPFALEAAEMTLNELPRDANYQEVTAHYAQRHRQMAEAAGAKWPDKLTVQDIERAGTSWHIFPNTIFLPTIDGALWYRARPNGDNPDSCVFDVWWLRRFPPGTEPHVEHEFYNDLASFRGKNKFLEQDFDNLAAIQKGVKSSGFKGARLNPSQEAQVLNFHMTLHQWLSEAEVGINA